MVWHVFCFLWTTDCRTFLDPGSQLKSLQIREGQTMKERIRKGQTMKERNFISYVEIFLSVFILLIIPKISFACDVTATSISQLNTYIAAASPGDTVCLQDGTYTNPSTINIGSSVDGTEANPIILKAETVGGVTLTGNPGSNIMMNADGDWWVIQDFKFIDISEVGAYNTYGIQVDGSNVRVSNNYFEGIGNLATKTYDWAIWVSHGASTTNCRIDYNTFTNNKAKCIMTSATSGGNIATYTTIDHNYFTDSGPDATSYIMTGTGDSVANNSIDTHVTIEYNIFQNHNDYGEPIDDKSSSNIIRHNVFRSFGGKTQNDGIVLRSGDDTTIDSNYFFDVGHYNIRVHGTGHKIINNYFENPGYGAILLAEGSVNYPNVSDILIANNTIVDFPVRGIYIGWWSVDGTKPKNLTFKNNIIKSSTGVLIRDEGHTGTFTWVTNLHYATGTATAWQKADIRSR